MAKVSLDTLKSAFSEKENGVREAEDKKTLPAPKIDAHGRSYATGKRKDAIARVWIKPGTGKITVNGRESKVYFARPVLRMLMNQPFTAVNRQDQYDVMCTVSGGDFLVKRVPFAMELAKPLPATSRGYVPF